MAIDDFKFVENDPAERAAWEALRTRAFYKAAAGKCDDAQAKATLEKQNGNINAAVDALDIDAEFKAEVDAELSL